jgi:hypothetical protein
MQSIQNSFFSKKLKSTPLSQTESLPDKVQLSTDNVRSGANPRLLKPLKVAFFSNSPSLSKSQPVYDSWTPLFDSGDR